jgi:sugar lactone lactonase YvrE
LSSFGKIASIFDKKSFESLSALKMSQYKVDVEPVKKVYLGEGPHWDAKNQQLYFVDILDKAIHRYVPSTGQDFKVVIEEKGEGHDSVSLVVPVENQPNKFVIGLGRSLRSIEWDGVSSKIDSMKTLHVVDDGNLGGRFNDGKCDSSGRLWAGTMGYEPVPGDLDEKKGLLYKLDSNGQLTKHVDKIDIANGLAWSPDNSIFYYIDTFTYRVDAFDYDASAGTISNRRPAFDLKANNITGVPDGMCIDATGNLWVCVFAGQRILHVDPKVGKMIDYIEFPAVNITSCAFGGPNLDILYATSAKHGRTPEQLAVEPEAGSLFSIKNTGAKGLSAGVSFAGNV